MEININVKKRHLAVFLFGLAVLMSIYIYAQGGGVSVQTDRPYHPLQQISKSTSDLTSVDSDGDGVIDYAESASGGGGFECVHVLKKEGVDVNGNLEITHSTTDIGNLGVANVGDVARLTTSTNKWSAASPPQEVSGVSCVNNWKIVGCSVSWMGSSANDEDEILFNGICGDVKSQYKRGAITAVCCKTIQIGPDNDGDGYNAPYDCDDNDSSTYPGAPELDDGKDNDCDGNV